MKYKELVLEALKKNFKELSNSGHAIEPKDYYVDDLELPEGYVDEFVTRHYSSEDDPKGMIFNSKGERLEYLDGVYNLQILKHMAWMLNPNSKEYEDGLSSLGRGSEARHYHNAIAKALV
mgnify:CR=1 FL=1|jgi:hypothetical protein